MKSGIISQYENCDKKMNISELKKCLLNKNDSNIRKKLIESNIYLVLNIIRINFNDIDFSEEELVSIGIEGLIFAIDHFDVNQKVGFIFFANRCIYRFINRFINTEMRKLRNTEEYKNKIIKRYEECFLEKLEEKELLEIIYQYMSELSIDDQKILLARFGFLGEYLEYPEVAKLMNMTTCTVNRRSNKSISKIRRRLKSDKIVDNIGVDVLKYRRKYQNSIYEYFHDFDEVIVDEYLSYLELYELELLKIKFGSNLDGLNVGAVITVADNNRISTILQKMRNWLKGSVKCNEKAKIYKLNNQKYM